MICLLYGPQKGKKSTFLRYITIFGYPIERVWNSKNHSGPTFASVESVLRIVRPPRLFQKIDMMICKPSNTHIMSRKVVEKILEAIEAALSTW